MYSMNKDGKVKWIPIEAQETEKRELPVNNIVSQEFWLENKKFKLWNTVDLFETLDEAIAARNKLKIKEPDIPLRIIKESRKIVG